MSTTNSGQEVLVGIDELTAVLMSSMIYVGDLTEWEKKAEEMIKEFTRLANLEGIFGKKKELESSPPQGYTVAYQYGDNPFYFAVAYHPSHPKMGVIVKFSAYSWAVYCERRETNIKRFLDSVSSNLYCVRLSRVDFTADYQNWDISVDDIYQKLKKKRLEIHTRKGKANHSEINAQETDGKASTFYVGSRKTGTRLFLRVYDKKKEQIEKKGFRYKEALNTKSWVRFETVFKGDYAHQLTNIIMSTDEKELADLIANKVAEKYSFYDLESEKYTDFTTVLYAKPEESFPCLRLESPRDNDFTESLMHLVNGSGLFPTLYKCDEIWGNKSSLNLLTCLYGIYRDDYAPNDDVQLWLKNHKKILAGQSLQGDLELLRLSSAKRKPRVTAKAEHKTSPPPVEDWEELFLQAETNSQQNEAKMKKYWEAEAERNQQQKERFEKYAEAQRAKRKSEITAKTEHKTSLPSAKDCGEHSLQAETNSQQKNAELEKIWGKQYSQMHALFNR